MTIKSVRSRSREAAASASSKGVGSGLHRPYPVLGQTVRPHPRPTPPSTQQETTGGLSGCKNKCKSSSPWNLYSWCEMEAIATSARSSFFKALDHRGEFYFDPSVSDRPVQPTCAGP